MSTGPRLRIAILVVLAVVLIQPALASGEPVHGASAIHVSLLCFCESAASKPTNTEGFGSISGLALVVVVVAAVAASLMGVLMFRLMKRDSGTDANPA